MIKKQLSLNSTKYKPEQTSLYSEDESYMDKLVSMNMQPYKIKKDFATEFTEWYRRVIYRASMIVEEWEKKIGITHSCQLDCNSCCYHAIEIYNYEVFAIFSYLKLTGRKSILEKVTPILDLIEKNISHSPFSSERYDESCIALFKTKYRSFQIPCIFQENKMCMIYPVRPSCCVTYYSYGPYEDCGQKNMMPQYCINHGSIEDWIVEQIINFLDYNNRRVPADFNPFSIDILPFSIRANLTKLNK